jgi:hypothetical protein
MINSVYNLIRKSNIKNQLLQHFFNVFEVPYIKFKNIIKIRFMALTEHLVAMCNGLNPLNEFLKFFIANDSECIQYTKNTSQEQKPKPIAIILREYFTDIYNITFTFWMTDFMIIMDTIQSKLGKDNLSIVELNDIVKVSCAEVMI